jgi:hypothetical protein
MQQFVGTSLKTRLYLLVSVAFIPIAFLIFYIAEEQKAIEEDVIFQKTLALARAAANQEDQKLESTRNLLTLVADLSTLVKGQPDKQSGLLAKLSRQSKGYEYIGILNPDAPVINHDEIKTGLRDISHILK